MQRIQISCPRIGVVLEKETGVFKQRANEVRNGYLNSQMN